MSTTFDCFLVGSSRISMFITLFCWLFYFLGLGGGFFTSELARSSSLANFKLSFFIVSSFYLCCCKTFSSPCVSIKLLIYISISSASSLLLRVYGIALWVLVLLWIGTYSAPFLSGTGVSTESFSLFCFLITFKGVSTGLFFGAGFYSTTSSFYRST